MAKLAELEIYYETAGQRRAGAARAGVLVAVGHLECRRRAVFDRGVSRPSHSIAAALDGAANPTTVTR